MASARRAAAVFAAAALASLAACAGADPPPPPGAAVAAPEPVAEDPANPPAPPAAETPAPAPAPAVAALPPSGPSLLQPPEDFRRLLGTKGDTVRHWMGDIVFVRRDGAAEIWRFAADTCFLDVFLYRESDGLRVAHVDARPRTTGRITPQACYARILSARNPKPAS